ncbi:MAG: hydroxymethylbilane synthase [Thermoguttaceae bacterium]|nr:hydroxymethylbilane synthase [Thermoguttaceae bacterium]
MNRHLYRLGTRGSRLALVQAESVANALRQQNIPTEIVIISTKGDRERDVKLSSLGGIGAFTKEIQHALLEHQIDLAVHSLKDLPTVPHEGLRLAAVPTRANTNDIAVLHPRYQHWDELPKNAIVGTGSLRRAAQLAHQSPRLQIRPIRGNVETRLRKLDQHEFDAIILAAAGLGRLGYQSRISHIFPSQILCPAAGQGAIGIEIRGDDTELKLALDCINHPRSMARVTAERAMLRTLGAGCSAPVGALAEILPLHDNNTVPTWRLSLHARVLSHDGKIALEMKDSVCLYGSDSLPKIQDQANLNDSAQTPNDSESQDLAKIQSMADTNPTPPQNGELPNGSDEKNVLEATPSAWLDAAEKLGITVAQRLIQLGANILLHENPEPIV